MTTLKYGGLEFSTDSSAVYTLDENALQGLFGAPPVRSDVDLVPNANGAFEPAEIHYGPRVATVSGLVLASTPAELEELFEDLANLPVKGEAEVVAETRTFLLNVGMAVSADCRALTDVVGKYTLQFVAWDPFKYGPEVTVSTGLPSPSGGFAWPLKWPINWGTRGASGRLVLPNTGRQASWPKFTVTGGLDSGFSLICVDTGDEIRFEFPMADTDYVALDSATGQVWINDPANVVSGFLTKSEWFAVPGGGTRTVQFNKLGGSSGSPILTGVISPAYL